MSANRNRGGRRAYLKHTARRHDKNPSSGMSYFSENGERQQHSMKDAIGLGRDINPINALPHRARLWLDKNKHTPTMTEPMRERTDSWHLHVKEQHPWHMQVCVDSAFNRIEMHFKGFTERAVSYFTWLDHISGVKKESFTMPKSKALEIRASGLKLNSIPWK